MSHVIAICTYKEMSKKNPKGGNTLGEWLSQPDGVEVENKNQDYLEILTLHRRFVQDCLEVLTIRRQVLYLS